jgi:hypothetical protein
MKEVKHNLVGGPSNLLDLGIMIRGMIGLPNGIFRGLGQCQSLVA